MKAIGNARQMLYLIGLTLMGLSFYVVVLLLLVVGAMSLFSGRAHAATQANAQGTSGTWAWNMTGSLQTARALHTATLLSNGKVLVTGGENAGGVLWSAELYDPATRTWSPAARMIANGRELHTATLLANGKVLIVGSETDIDAPELYDSNTNTWTPTGKLNVNRWWPAATRLQDGRVLVSGGQGQASAEIYDPVTGTWSLTGSLALARYGHTATLLPSGKVLVAGGWHDEPGGFDGLGTSSATDTSELYDPATGKWTTVAPTPTPLVYHAASILPGGAVIVIGGKPDCCLESLRSVATFDPISRLWHSGAPMIDAREIPTATLLDNGKVLVAGGLKVQGTLPNQTASVLKTAEVYDGSGWIAASSLNVARAGHTATRLADGRVLVVGGGATSSDLGFRLAGWTTAAELYEPAVAIDASFTGSWFNPVQGGHGLMLEVLPDNRLLALWFAFDPAGKQAWFGGVGTYSGNTATITGAALPTGGRWIPDFDPNAIVANSWGTLTLTFVDHDHGHVDFVAGLGFGSGGMDLLRLTNVATQSAVATPIGSPGAVVADASGNVYFSSSPNRIFKVDAQGVLTRIAGSGQPGYDGDGGPATEARFNFPLSYLELVQDPIDYSELVGGLALDAQHNLYVADAYNNRVRRIDNNGIVTTVLGNGFRANSGDGGPAVQGTVYWPQGVAVDNQGNLYVTSAYGPLRQVSASGLLRTITAQNCGQTYLSAGLCVPEQIAVDSSGNVFAPDGYCRVREVRGDGSTLTVAGNDDEPSGGFAFTCGYSGDGGPATAAALSAPYAVAIDAGNKLYIADTGNHCIRKVAAGIISTVAGRCTQPGFAGDGGTATQALLDHPRGVAVGADGSLYIADTNNNRIRKVLPNGIITTIAGNGGPLVDTEHGTIGPGFTGNWFDPAQSGHGLMLEVLSDNRLLAYWFAFDPAGNQAWFGGVGSYSGTTATIPNVILPTGGKWIPNFDPHSIVANVWGTLTFTFTSCNRGTVTFNSTYGFGSGSMNLTRLTQPAGLSCP